MSKEEKQEPGVLSYDQSPGMTGEHRYRLLKKPAPSEKFVDRRPRDEAGHVYREVEKGKSKTQCTLRFRDGTSRPFYYPSIKEGLAMGTSEDFRRSDLRGVDLSGVRILSVDFSNASFVGANCRGTNFDGCKFDSADLCHADFQYGSFQGCSFRKAKMDGASLFNNADLSYANFEEADTFEYIQKTGANLEGIEGVDLEVIEGDQEPSEEEQEALEQEELEQQEGEEEEEGFGIYSDDEGNKGVIVTVDEETEGAYQAYEDKLEDE